MNDTPAEFEEDLIALDDYRCPRLVCVFPDPRIAKAIQAQAHAQMMATVGVAVAVFVLLLAVLP